MELVRKSDRWVATVSTLGFHGLLLLLFLLYKLVTPIPPYPVDGGGGLGVELNFGDSEVGMGMSNPEERSAPAKPQPPPQVENAPLLTSEVEDDNYVEPVRPKPKKPVPQPKELKRPETGPRITKTDPVPVPPARLYSGKKTGGAEGNTGKDGNQGKEDGDPYGRVYEGRPGSGGSGNGGPGSGGGSGGGDGTGTGAGRGSGISFSLGTRGGISLPKPGYTSEKSGFVVVDITVDRNGNVLKARAGAKGTTVQDSELFRQAESAARRAKFKSDPSAAEQQHGTITYQFIRN